jgi:alpha-glucosidase
VSDNNPNEWWRNGVVYQVYIRSFADGNGDGTGDLAGLRSKLPYLADLGVDAIWVNPWFPSPLADGGYDVADYRDIEPQFGTLAEAELFIKDARTHGIRTIVDLVPNHCSDQHVWFQAALEAGPQSPERARFHFRPGRGDDGSEPPSNWTSVFGGPAWTQVDDGEWYLHLFDPSQPDLNWEHPEVRSEFESILRFWLDRDAAGFRVDVAHGLVKDMAFPDLTIDSPLLSNSQIPNHPHWDRDGVHEIIRGWRSVLDEYDDAMMVAEAWVSPDSLGKYLRPDEYHQSFSFDLLGAPWTPAGYREPIERSFAAATSHGATATWVLSNHDVMRVSTRLGLPDGTDWRRWPVTGPAADLDQDQGLQRARAAALITLGLPGSAYIYQGEELGLPEVWDLPEDVLDDPVWTRSGGEQKGRDGCRVPLPWNSSGPSFGFGDTEPWLPQPTAFQTFAQSEQVTDAESTLNLYRAALRVRRDHLTGDETLTMLDLGPSIFGYERGSGVRCIVNMGAEPIELEGNVLLSSIPLTNGLLPVDTAVWIQ